ncbi:MAG: PDZ domain-containing protein [Planctomycetia bacterium]|nr:PDZ domain-containing protein [Planctomycetia bacterium]
MRKKVFSLSLLAVAALVIGAAGICVLAGEKAGEANPAAKETAEKTEASDWWIGLGLGPIPDEVRAQLSVKLVPEERGVWVSFAAEDAPAAKAGIEPYDVLVKINGETLNMAQDVIDAVKASKGKALAFEVVRAGEVLKLGVTPMATPDEVKAARRAASRRHHWSMDWNDDNPYSLPHGMSLPDDVRKMLDEMEKRMQGRIRVGDEIFEGKVEDLTEEPEQDGPVTEALPAPGEKSQPAEGVEDDAAKAARLLPQGTMSFQRSLRSMVNGKVLSISVNQQGDAPAKVLVEWDGQTYTTTSDKLEDIPEEIRDTVRQFSEQGVFRTQSGPVEAAPAPAEKNDDPNQIELDQSKVRNLN